MNNILIISSSFQIVLSIITAVFFIIKGNLSSFPFIAVFAGLQIGTGFLGLQVAIRAKNRILLGMLNLCYLLICCTLIYYLIESKGVLNLGVAVLAVYSLPYLFNLITIPFITQMDITQIHEDPDSHSSWKWRFVHKLSTKPLPKSLDTLYTSLAALTFAAMMSMAIWCAKENEPVNHGFQQAPFACCYLLGFLFLVIFTALGWGKFFGGYLQFEKWLMVVNLLLLLCASGIALHTFYLFFESYQI